MSEKDEGAQDRPAGSAALTKYRAHGGGIELFRAYIDRRKADQQANLQRKTEVIEALNPTGGTGIPVDAFERLTSELTMLQILEELDPVIKDLLRFCMNPGLGGDQLPNLRSALRIGGDGHAPSDSEQAERKWAVQERWIGAYLTMQETGIYRSQNDIARDIAKALGVSQRTAINHWTDKKLAEPWQASWALSIEMRAKTRAQRKVREQQSGETSRRRGKLTFGKGV
ncbi:hypothetical protein [Cupriavidus numazuensis]|uniref:Uncharacterized protein n=1 Tax=Cupriavidus numazuensis TaxID=221992 RepID=A0ABN7PYF6_9BURK|nr:hypothetical protein [Cupriavidus numazuensis]CAG2136051.1 hypothetical protein LMG26411_01188 [Cupriavidus numazuensis]